MPRRACSRKVGPVNTLILAAQAAPVAAAGKFGAKFFAFWIIVVLVVAALIAVPVLIVRARRGRAGR
jgi:hypothetical protein